ncbi:MAG: hypothetical protein DRR03_07255, partial [Gammaproteobacteria bacterium]
MMTDAEGTRRNPWPGRLLRTALVVACLAYAVWNVDPDALFGILADIDPLRVVLVTLFTTFGYLALAVRLHLLSHRRLPLRTGLAASLVALGVNNLLPAKLGEV